MCNKTNANIWLSGDFNQGHIDWNIPSVVSSKPDPSLHQNLLDILNDHTLTQFIDKPTRNDRTLDLLCMSNPSFINRIETLPPMVVRDSSVVRRHYILLLEPSNVRAQYIRKTADLLLQLWVSTFPRFVAIGFYFLSETLI